jgi:hypothetical protein
VLLPALRSRVPAGLGIALRSPEIEILPNL